MDNFFFTKENALFSKEFTNTLLDKFNLIFKEKVYQNNNLNIREFNKDTISKEPLFELAISKINDKFQMLINATDLKFNKLWLVNSISDDTKKNILPYVPHIDKKRFLKAMVYLHDISLEHGPIHLGKVKNNIDIEKIRKELPKDYKIKGLNIVNKNQIQEILTPMLGKAGDVIFFDTNVPHKAGVIKEGFNRKVLRFDFERPSYNSKKNYIKNIINKIIK